MALLHDAFGHAEESTDVAQFFGEGHDIFSAVEVGRGDHFKKWRTCAIQVNERARIVVAARQLMAEFPRVFFEVRADDSNRARAARRNRNHHAAIVAKRQVVLRNLVALRKIGVVVILAIPLGVSRNRATEREPHHHRHFDGGFVHHRKRTGQRTHHRIDERVRIFIEVRRMRRVRHTREHLGARREFNVNLKPDFEVGRENLCGLRIDSGRRGLGHRSR